MKPNRKISFKNPAILLFTYLITGCASTPLIHERNTPPEQLLVSACGLGKNIGSVQGTVWLKTKSKEISGQFAANVLVPNSHQMKLEVTNFLGGTEALISVSNEHYVIIGGQNKNDEGYGTWGGIPLKWAPELFLGRIPCPSQGQKRNLSLGSQGELIVQVPRLKGEAERYVFEFRQIQGKEWPKSLHWEKLSSPVLSVDFEFDDPENETLSPKKWEARSEQGAVKVRWRDREVSSLNAAH